MAQHAESSDDGRLKALPQDRKILQQWYPGWHVLIARLTDTSLRANDVRRMLGLTYRQIHHWHVRKLLWYEQNSENQWRRFSIADIFGLALIKCIADLGIPFDKLQKSFAVKAGVPGLLWNVLPNIIEGSEAFLYTDFENFCNLIIHKRDSDNRTAQVPIDSKSEEPIVVLPLKPILDVLTKKLDLTDFRVLVDENGSYSFQINGVPLRLEDLHCREKTFERKPKISGRITSKHK